MFALNPAKFSLTLVFALTLLLALSSPIAANDHSLPRRDHSTLKRLVKKRSPLPASGGLFSGSPFGLGEGAAAGAANDPDPTIGSASSTGSAIATSASSAVTSQSSTASASSASTTASASESSTASGSSTTSSSSASSDSTSASATSSSSASSTASSDSASTSSTPSASSTPSVEQQQPAAPTQQPDNGNTQVAAASISRTSQAVVTKTTTVDPSDVPVIEPQSASAKSKSTTLTVLIAVAASVGGVAILWTIFRKWKLGRSSKFDERLQPIDWQPKAEDDGLPGVHRSTSRASSFHSAGHSNNNYSDHGHGANGLQPIPDHDFTAGAAKLAPVGGYADLARGPSPQPQMHEPLARGPSFNRGYDTGVPLHHQTGYGTNDTYDYNGGAARY